MGGRAWLLSSPSVTHIFLISSPTWAPTRGVLSSQKARPSLYCSFTLSGLSLPNSSLSPNGSGVISLFYTLREPQTPLTLLTTWNCDSVNFPNYSSVLCTRQGLSQLQLSQLLGLVPAREEGPKSCLLNE